MVNIYTVRQQYPHREIACFWKLNDACAFIQLNRYKLAYPIVTSKFVTMTPKEVTK